MPVNSAKNIANERVFLLQEISEKGIKSLLASDFSSHLFTFSYNAAFALVVRETIFKLNEKNRIQDVDEEKLTNAILEKTPEIVQEITLTAFHQIMGKDES